MNNKNDAIYLFVATQRTPFPRMNDVTCLLVATQCTLFPRMNDVICSRHNVHLFQVWCLVMEEITLPVALGKNGKLLKKAVDHLAKTLKEVYRLNKHWDWELCTKQVTLHFYFHPVLKGYRVVTCLKKVTNRLQQHDHTTSFLRSSNAINLTTYLVLSLDLWRFKSWLS